ncbi:MAG: adenylyl-sulfate kinase [Elusimicrobia bacterium]|nr:adenylyl-sulfate kinase [Elusimicrobiota bacterium]
MTGGARVHKNLTRHSGKVSPERRREKLGQRGSVIWFTGLSGSGKSTVAREVEALLVESGRNAAVLDGDNVRLGLNKDAALLAAAGYGESAARRFGLGFSAEDRTENIRRVGEVAKLFAENNVVALTAFISPFRADRDLVRALMPKGAFFEVHVAAPLAVCEARDPKGLYKKARAGAVGEFTGIASPYEPPRSPELVLHSDRETPAESAHRVLALLKRKGVL